MRLRHREASGGGSLRSGGKACTWKRFSARNVSERYPLDARYACETCFGPLEVAYDFSGLDPAEARRRIQAGPPTLWRYADFLPFERRPDTALAAGVTPLIRADRLAERLGVGEVWVKNDAANPTHSFKDRVVTVALAKARELGYDVVACASTGNLANAVAAHAAAAGLESYVFVPADLEEQKILATGVYGTNLVAVRGSYDDVNRLCTELAGERDWAFVNVNVRPYYAEGSKTLGYEIAEQLGFELPDRVVVPIASGSLFSQIARGFEEWLEVGLVDGRAAGLLTAPRPRAARRWRRRSRRAARSAARSSRRRSPSRSRSATRPTAPTRSTSRGAPAAGSTPCPTTRSATASGCSPRPPASSRRPPAASPSPTLARLAERGDIGPDERVWS